MAQDDMHVLIYKALAYLYDCMKRGKEPDKAMLSCTGLLFGGIPERYWTSVWIQMLDKDLVKGVSIAHHDDEVHVVIMFWSSDILTGSQTKEDNESLNLKFWSSDILTGSQTASESPP